MKHFLFFILLVSFSVLSYGQEANLHDYQVSWKKYVKENAPFNEVKDSVYFTDLKWGDHKLNLGNLKYQQVRYTVGQELLGVACLLVEAVKDHQIYKKQKNPDPVKYYFKDK